MQIFSRDIKKLIAGCDEVGRGCLAGPVVAAAVVLHPDNIHPKIGDSKSISKNKLSELSDWIKENAQDYAITTINPSEIDQINILQASIKAMHISLAKLHYIPSYILVDGNKFHSYLNVPHSCVVKGDSKFYCIAAASILAKVFRDTLMKKLHEIYPQYDWHKNVGYPTRHHRYQIDKQGYTPFHRKSFYGISEKTQINLFNS